MKYQEEKAVKQQIKKYTENKNERYAILIDGDWGYGKTWFVKKVVIPELEKRGKKIVYLSLYGKKKKEEIEEEITIEILKKEMETKGISKEFDIRNLIAGLNTFSDILNRIEEKIPKVKFEKLMKILISDNLLKEYIFFLDDLERRAMDINEIFAYINYLVEQKECKCILIANQKEMIKNHISNNLELKYLVASNLKINLEEKEEVIDLERLKERTNQVFEQDFSYNQMKEKLIGYTIPYKPNLDHVYSNLLEKLELKAETIQFLKEKKKSILEVFETCSYYNIRTLQYLMNILDQIIPSVSKVKVEEFDQEILDSTKDKLGRACTYLSIVYKKGCEGEFLEEEVGYHEEDFAHLNLESVLCFKFMEEIVQGYMVEEERIQNVLIGYMKELSFSSKHPKDPLNQLNWYMELEDEKIEELIEVIQKKIENNQYAIDLYPKIITFFLQLNRIGFATKLSETVQAMKKNIAGRRTDFYAEQQFKQLLEKEEKEQYQKIIDELKNEVNSVKEEIKKELNKILKERKKEWGEDFYQFCDRNKVEIFNAREFFRLIDLNIFCNAIQDAEVRDLANIRKAVEDIYGIGNSERFYSDFSNLKRVILMLEKIEKERNFSRMKQFNLQLLQKKLKMVFEQINLLQRGKI